jgi:hypothetical protein
LATFAVSQCNEIREFEYDISIINILTTRNISPDIVMSEKTGSQQGMMDQNKFDPSMDYYCQSSAPAQQ